MRAEQYRRKGSAEHPQSALLERSRRGSKEDSVRSIRSNRVEPNLGAELCTLCPLLLLIFVEVAALGLPVAILPIITTTEFARTQFRPEPATPPGSELGADGNFGFYHDGELTGTDPPAGCLIGDYNTNLDPQVEDDDGNEIPNPEVPRAPRCPDPEEDGPAWGLPEEYETVPCCGPPDGGDGDCSEEGQCFLSYPTDTCPTSLVSICDEAGEFPNNCDATSNHYYVNRQACFDANGFAAAALAYSDAARNILTFLCAGLIGAVADSTGRRTILILAEIVASLPNLALWLWWILGPGENVSPAPLSIYVYYVVRALSGLMNSVAVGVAYVADVTSEENRAVCIGILIAIAAIGIASAPIGTQLPYGVSFAVSNVMNLFTVIFCIFCIKESLPEEDRIPLDRERVNPLRTMGVLVRNKLFILLTIVILANSASNKGTTDINAFVLQRNFGFDSTQIGVLIVGLAGAVIFVQAFTIKPLIMCIGERGTIFLGIAAGLPLYIGISIAAFGNCSEQWVAYVLIIVFGAMSSLVFPAISSMESRNSDKDEQGLVQGALFGAQSLAQALGGLVFPTVYAAVGAQGGSVAYGIAAVVQVVALIAIGLVPKGAG